jgi:hypothetical protein
MLLKRAEGTMTHTIVIKRLSYDRDRELVAAELAGEMGGRHVDVQLQFALRAHGERTESELRRAILLEIQQILRSAANVTLADPTGTDDSPE